MKYSVRHQTRYIYDDPVSISHNRLHSRPRECDWQSRSQPTLVIEPEPAFLNHHNDFFGNPVSFFTVQSPHRELNVVVMFEAVTSPRQTPECDEDWTTTAERLSCPATPEAISAAQFRFESPWARSSEKLTKYAGQSFSPKRTVVEGATDLCSRIYQDFEFDDQATDVATPLSEVFDKRRGVCQDFAHLAISGLRGLGIAARYVSGYLRTVPPPGQERLQGADASHAWISVWTPQGWVDLDPTNNCLANEDHITLAWGRDFHDVCPLRGVVLGGGAQSVRVGVDVIPIDSEA